MIRRAETGNVVRNFQQSLDETIGHPRRNTPDTPDLITHPPAACSLPHTRSLSLFSFPFNILSPPRYFLLLSFSLSFLSRSRILRFSLAASSAGFLALFVSTAIEDNVVGRGENNIGVTEAGVYCDDSTMNFHRIDGSAPLSVRATNP